MSYDLIIIGAGPAGITAGIYAARQRLKTLLITKDFGGQIAKKAVDIENYPGFKKISGLDLVEKFENHLRAQEVEIREDEVLSIAKNNQGFLISSKTKEKIETKTVIIASGAKRRFLGVPGEKEFIGKGVSFCAVCDGPLFKDKTAAVIGAGNAGFETAIFLSNYVKKIYILEFGPEIKADKINQEIIKKSGKTEIITNTAIKEIKGKNFVDAIVYQDLKSNKTNTLEVDGVFVEIGFQPATSFIKDLVDFSEQGEIKVDPETQETITPGLYAVGDVNVGEYKQIVTACGEGAKAVLAAYKYLQKL